MYCLMRGRISIYRNNFLTERSPTLQCGIVLCVRYGDHQHNHICLQWEMCLEARVQTSKYSSQYRYYCLISHHSSAAEGEGLTDQAVRVSVLEVRFAGANRRGGRLVGGLRAGAEVASR